MSRNVKSLMFDVFNQLAKPFLIDESEVKKRAVFVTEEEHKQLSSGVKILSSFPVTKNDIILIALLDGEPFLLSIGNYSTLNLTFCEEWQDEPALFLSVISQLKILPKKDNKEDVLREHIFTEEEKNSTVSWDDLSMFFPLFSLFKIKEQLPTEQTDIDYYLRSIVISLLCQNGMSLNLPFEDATLSAYVDVLNNSSNIPVDNFIHSLLSNEWKFCFLDLYRCIERLFKISWTHKFRESLGCLPSIQIVDAAMDMFRVESHEDQSMKYMFSILPPLSEEMKTIIGKEKVDKYIYGLRNEIVHFQKSDQRVHSIEDESWNITLRFLLRSIECLYKKFEQYIRLLPDK